jgi:hypothetical protein
MITKAKLCKDSMSGIEISVIVTMDDGKEWSVPFDEANTDYQAYLKFLEDGGIPEPADE